jgi:NADH-ubiquinone oxidoreductase chain 4
MFIASYKIQLFNIIANLFSSTCCLLLLVLVLCFTSKNLLSFYIYFEASLIPTILLILIWGYQPERLQARIYLIVYTVVASLPLLLIIILIYYNSNHINISYPWIMFPLNMDSVTGSILLLIAFIVKLPLFSVHLWLPKAHVEAPVAGSIILAAILLKLGGYGLIRVCFIFPKQLTYLYAPITSIALIGAVITGFICLRQPDIKSLIAYSSVGHMGLLVAGVFSFTKWGLIGALAIILAHGIISSGMFCLANITYEITHTRRIVLTKGLLYFIPTLSLIWFLTTRANIAAPPTINLLREIILIIGAISQNIVLALPLGLLRFIGAAYSLYLYSSLNHGGIITISNRICYLPSRYYILAILHLIPVIVLIIMPTYITSYIF